MSPALALIIHAALAFTLTMLHAGIARWIAGRIFRGNKHAARVAAFSLAIGYMIGEFGFQTQRLSVAVVGFTRIAGAVAALVLLWYLFFRRHRVHVGDEQQ